MKARPSKQGGLHSFGRPYLLRKVYMVGKLTMTYPKKLRAECNGVSLQHTNPQALKPQVDL